MIWVVMSLTVLEGIAKPIPFAAPSVGSTAASVGIPTTLPLLWDIAMDAPFVEGRYTTSYLTERAPFLPSLRQDPAR